MKIIGLEEHWWTAELSDALRRVTGDARDDAVAQLVNPARDQRMRDAGEGRLADMRECGVDLQVLSVGPPATQSLPAADAVPMARDLNDRLAAAVTAHPNRFAAFATLPTPDPDAAAAELERAVTQLGCVGTMINGRTGDRMLDDPAYDDIFAVAARLDVPVYIHPQIPARAVRTALYSGLDPTVEVALATGGWGWHMEAGLAALRLILRGTLDRHPDLKLILGHWGEMLTYWVERVNRISPLTGLDREIAEYVRDNLYVTPSGIFHERLLRRSVVIVGAEHILFSTDYPFGFAPEKGARHFLENAPLSQEEIELIAHGNAERLLRL